MKQTTFKPKQLNKYIDKVITLLTESYKKYDVNHILQSNMYNDSDYSRYICDIIGYIQWNTKDKDNIYRIYVEDEILNKLTINGHKHFSFSNNNFIHSDEYMLLSNAEQHDAKLKYRVDFLNSLKL